jgi:hypothetical protein
MNKPKSNHNKGCPCADSHRASSPVFLGNQTATDCRQLLIGEGRLPAAKLARHLDEAWFGGEAIARVGHSWRSLLGHLDGQPWRMEDATQSINAQEADRYVERRRFGKISK